jgi:hypothetical protein
MFRLHLRSFVSLLLSIAFPIVLLSGLVLLLTRTPEFLAVGRGVWKHVHIFVSLLLAATIIAHLTLNWAVYWSYVRQALGRRTHLGELVAAVLLVAAVVGTAAMEDHGGGGAMNRFGATSLRDAAARGGISTEQAIAALQNAGIHVHDPAVSLAKIAQHNGVTPPAVLQAIDPSAKAGSGSRHRGGEHQLGAR